VADEALPFVTVIMPTLNEAGFIERAIKSLLENNYPPDKVEILVVDGGSKDGTVEIVRKMADKSPNIKLLGGPGVNCPAAMNIGIKNAKGEIICKIDGHGYVDRDFIRLGVSYLQSDATIKCTGGPIRPVPRDFVGKSNALARSSVFGVGGGINTVGEKPQFTDTVQCGIYRKELFDTIGLFDESLQFGEDEEINWRIIKAGYKIYCTPEIKFYFYPRESFRGFYRQYFNYGRARVKVFRKHKDFLRAKHLVPSVFVLSILASGILLFLHPMFLWVLLIIIAAYLSASIFFSVLISQQQGWQYLCALPVSFACLHFGYGIGFLKGVWDFLFK